MPWLQPHKLSVWSPCSTGGMHNDLGDSSSAINAFASFVYQLTPSSCCSSSLKFHLTSQQIHNSPLQSCPNGLLLHLDTCLEELIVQNMCTYNIGMLLKKIQCRKWFFCHGFCFFLSLITKQATFFIVSFSRLSLYCNCLFTTQMKLSDLKFAIKSSLNILYNFLYVYVWNVFFFKTIFCFSQKGDIHVQFDGTARPLRTMYRNTQRKSLYLNASDGSNSV